MLFISGTTLSVPALTGAIMTMGVATANSILLVSFARQRQQEGAAPALAALEAGATRIRPVLMTALAMIIGMIPMALGIGEGAEQNAPLGRAVIGGLLFATVSTLLFVPVVFAGVHDRLARHRAAPSARDGGARGTAAAGALSDGRAPRTAARRSGAAGRRRRSAPRVARGTRIAVIVVLVLLVVGAGRTIVGRMANAKVLEANVSRGRGAVRQDDGRPHQRAAARRWPCPARCRASSRRRWRRARPATSSAGPRTSAATSPRASCSPVIESPEIDQQLSQADAARSRRRPASALAKSTVERWEALRKKDVVSQQELDERRSGLTQAIANLAAADANVQRLRQLQGFTRVTAPFDGVITRRNVDVGDLIDSSGKTLFVLTQMDPLRVYVNVPQSYAQLVEPGQKVVITQAELRGQIVRRRGGAHVGVDRSGDADDAGRGRACRTGRRLLPGAYVQVELPLAGSRTLVVPTNVLLFRGEGTRVAAVDAASKVHLKPVTLGRNLGESIEVVDGIAAGDRLVVNPSDSLGEGDTVAVAANDDGGRRRGRGRRDAASQGAAVTGARPRSRAAARRRGTARLAVARSRRLLAGCVAGPDYVRPAVETPPAWKVEAPWREGTPDDAAPKGPWWQRFGDARLDALQAQALAQSPTLALASARLAQARAVVAATSAGQLPSVEPQRARRCASASRPTGRSATTPRPTSRRCRTTSSSRSRSTTSSTSPAACSARVEGVAGERRAGGRRLREHAPPARHRPRDRLLQPARDRHRARRAGALDRPAAALARLRPHPPRPRRRLGPRRRPAAGAARHDADPARRAAPPARRRSSTRSRR